MMAVALLRHPPFAIVKIGTIVNETPTILVLAGLALMLALVLSALHRPLVQLYEGYPFGQSTNPWGRYLRQREAERWLELHTAIERLRDEVGPDDPRLANLAATQFTFDTNFPRRADDLLPTRLGNRIRAFELYAMDRYGLDPVILWPRLLGVIPKEFQAILGQEEASFTFLVNLVFLTQAFALMLIAVSASNPTTAGVCGAFAGLGLLVLSYALYRGACVQAVSWGYAFRAAYDLYRRDLLRKLDITPPATLDEERLQWLTLVHLFSWGEGTIEFADVTTKTACGCTKPGSHSPPSEG